MQLGMIGLGRMGANMVRRLMRDGHQCVVYDVYPEAVQGLVKEGAVGAKSLDDFAKKLTKPRAAWIMVPAAAVDKTLVDLSVRLRKEPTVEEINAHVRRAAEGPLKGILEYCDRPIVSSDVIGNPHSSVFDALSTLGVGDGFYKLIAWYDNEWGYSQRVVDLIARLAALGRP